MKVGNFIPSCPLVPCVIPHAKTADYQQVQSALAPDGQRPLLFFLCQSTFEEPQSEASRYVTWSMKYVRDIGFGTYSDMVDVRFDVMSALAERNTFVEHIGIVSRRTPDLCGFFIVRWLIDECGIEPGQALDMFAQSCPPGITKPKYLRFLNRIYDVHLGDDTPQRPLDTPRGEIGSAPVKLRDPREILSEIEPAKAVSLLNEVREMCDCVCERIPLCEYFPLNAQAIQQILSETESLYCLAIEPVGSRALLYVKDGEYNMFLESGVSYLAKVTSKLHITAILEGVLVFHSKPTFVLCDIWMLNSENVRSKPFDIRMALIEDYVFQPWIPTDADTLSLELRHFYEMKNYSRVIGAFRENCVAFKRYSPSGFSLIDLKIPNGRAYLWQATPWEYPRVRVDVDYVNMVLFGYATTNSTSIVIAFLGEATNEGMQFAGKVVEIKVVEKDPSHDDILNGEILHLAKNQVPWSFADFAKWYPDQKPVFKVDEMAKQLKRIAKMRQYS